jgi:lipopolysaccharide export system permease protein
LSLLWCGGLFLLDDRVLAHANRQAEALEDQIKGTPSHTSNPVANSNWLADRAGRIYYYSLFDPQQQAIYGLSVFDPVANYSRLELHSRIPKATFVNGAWQAESGWTQAFPEPTRAIHSTFANRALDLEPPEHFSGMHNNESDLMTYGDLRAHITQMAQSGISPVGARVELAQRLAFPFVALIMTILGVTFGVTTGRRGALYGVGLALVLGAGYWMVDTFFVAIGQAGLLPPILSAWAANALFLALAIYSMLTVRT